MAVSGSRLKKKSTHEFTFASFEFAKIYLVRDERIKRGFSAYELSFLLGKDDHFVKYAENPLEKKRYGINDTNYLWLIFGGPLSAIMPERIEVNSYHVRITHYSDGRKDNEYYIEKKDTKDAPYEFYREIKVEEKHAELSTPSKVFTFEEARLFIDELLADGYFNTPQRALDIYQKCQLKFGSEFHPRNMIKVLNFYTNKKSGIPKLNKEKKNEFGRTLFIKLAD